MCRLFCNGKKKTVIFPGSTAKGPYCTRVGAGQPAGHAGQTHLLVHLQTANLGRPDPSLLPQRDRRGSHQQVMHNTCRQTGWFTYLDAHKHMHCHIFRYSAKKCLYLTHLHTNAHELNIVLVAGLCRHTVPHIAELFREKGSDCWWELPIETLLPAEVLKKVSVCGRCSLNLYLLYSFKMSFTYE